MVMIFRLARNFLNACFGEDLCPLASKSNVISRLIFVFLKCEGHGYCWGRGEEESFDSSSKFSNPPNIKVPFYTSEKNMYAPIIVIKIVRCPQLHV